MLTAPSDFFDLTRFGHRTIFDAIDHVWQALDRLVQFFDAFHAWEIRGEVAPGAVVRGPVFLGRGTVVEPGAMIIGPAVIGENCSIRHSAYLRGFVLAGDDCVIGHCSEAKNAILLDNARAPHFNYVGDSILGGDVNLGAGTVCANLRLDERKVSASDPSGERIPTGRAKLGAIIGDGSRTACNVVLNPGSLVPKGSFVHHPSQTLAVIRGNVGPAEHSPSASGPR